MKKIYNILFVTVLVLMASCSLVEDNLFDESSSVRGDEAVQHTMNILSGNESGWIMKYYPDKYKTYGGYSFYMNFDKEGFVTVASELTEEKTAQSSFSIKNSAGVVLSFDTLNDIFHLMADPSAPIVGDNGIGMGGDNDFLVLEATAEKVTLKGKKSGSITVLTPLKKEEVWSDTFSQIITAEEQMFFKSAEFNVDTTKVSISSSYRTLTFFYKNAEESNEITVAYIVNKEGFEFYESIEVLGVTIDGLLYDSAKGTFTTKGSAALEVVKIVPPLNEQLVNGQWFIKFSDMGPFGQTYFNHVYNNTPYSVMGETLIWAYLGDNFCFSFNSSGYGGTLGFNYTYIGDNQISMKFNMTGTGDGVWYHNNASFHFLLNVFGYSSERTFTLETDNINMPTWIKLTEDANPDNWIKLSDTPTRDLFNE